MVDQNGGLGSISRAELNKIDRFCSACKGVADRLFLLGEDLSSARVR